MCNMVVKDKKTGQKFRVFDIDRFNIDTMFLIYKDCGFIWSSMNNFILCAEGDGKNSN